MASGKSDVWKFFKICNNDKTKAECSLCDSTSQKPIIRGKTPKFFSTKPLWNHLKSKHPLAMRNLDREIDASKDEDNPSISDSSGSSSSTVTTSKSEPQQIQPTLVSEMKKKQMWSLDDPRSINITKKISTFYFLFYFKESLFYYE